MLENQLNQWVKKKKAQVTLEYFVFNDKSKMFGKQPGYNILQLASIGGYADVVNKYLKKSIIEIKSPLKQINSKTPKEYTNEYTSAHLSAIHGHAEVLKILLFHKADLTIQDALEKQPLHYAAENGYKDVIMTILEKKYDNINKIDKNGKTPLHYVTGNGHIKCLELLLQYDSVLHLPDNDGR